MIASLAYEQPLYSLSYTESTSDKSMSIYTKLPSAHLVMSAVVKMTSRVMTVHDDDFVQKFPNWKYFIGTIRQPNQGEVKVNTHFVVILIT
jgi:hypothetical protein